MMNTETDIPQSWLIVAHSAIGKAHIKKNLPCQDAHYLLSIDNETGIAIVCDGAGSAPESHTGAKIVAKQIAIALKREIETVEQLFSFNDETWKAISHKVLLKVFSFLERFAKKTNKEIKSLACTVIAVVYNPHHIYICHIGDGRAAYCNKQGDWQAIMIPFKGEEANQTMFITSDLWRNNFDYIGCKIINDDISAFTLMSDGCENHSFQLNRYDEENKIYILLNQPYIKFFQPLTEQLLSLNKSGYSNKKLNTEWQEFIEQGNENLAKENDDKTMILGILKS